MINFGDFLKKSIEIYTIDKIVNSKYSRSRNEFNKLNENRLIYIQINGANTSQM